STTVASRPVLPTTIKEKGMPNLSARSTPSTAPPATKPSVSELPPVAPVPAARLEPATTVKPEPPKADISRPHINPALASKVPPLSSVTKAPAEQPSKPTATAARDVDSGKTGTLAPPKKPEQPSPRRTTAPSHMQHLKPIAPPTLKQQAKPQPTKE